MVCLWVFEQCHKIQFVQQSCRCQDYILIDHGEEGSIDICDQNSIKMFDYLKLSNFTVYFRTSEESTFKGFQMRIACIRNCDMQGEV